MPSTRQIISIFSPLILLLLLNFVPNKVHPSPSSPPLRFTANPLLCSFTDDATGFYASWHSNCSGLINFLVNVRDFPRPDMPPLPGPYRPMAFGYFWAGIGFKLLSTELALIENLPGGPFVSVSAARFERGKPPAREIGSGILINPRGSFIGSSMLEATFSIDESILARGCKEFLFFTALTPINAPYGALPFSKTICDVAQTCARFQCPGGELGSPIGSPLSMPMGEMPMSTGGRMPLMDYFDADYIGQMPLPAQQQILAAASAMTNGEPNAMMNYEMGGFGQPINNFYPQMDPTGYGGGYYGQYRGGGQFNNNFWPCPPGYQPSYSAFSPSTSSAYLTQLGQQGYGEFGNGQFNALCPPGYVPSTMPHSSLYSPLQSTNYLYSRQQNWPYPSMIYPSNGYQRLNSPTLVSPLEKEAAKREARDVDSSKNLTDADSSNSTMESILEIEIVLNSPSLPINSTELDIFPLEEPPPQKPTLNTAISPFPYERQKRATSSIDGFNSLQGTAYEGQDKPFQKEPPTPASGGRYLALAEWRAKTGQIPMAPPPSPIWSPIDQGGQNQSQMYWPYRTVVGVDSNAWARAQREQPFPQPPAPMANFYDLVKCDGGFDPEWCADYLRQATKSKSKPKIAGTEICQFLVDSLRNSNHRCCNALQRMGC